MPWFRRVRFISTGWFLALNVSDSLLPALHSARGVQISARCKEVTLSSLLYYSGIVFATKWLLLSVILREGTSPSSSFTFCYKTSCGSWIFVEPQFLRGICDFLMQDFVLYTSLASLRRSSKGSGLREPRKLVTLAYLWYLPVVRRSAVRWIFSRASLFDGGPTL